MMKSFLKTLFPIVFLKKAFVLYNTIKRGTVDRIFFPPLKIKQEAFKTRKEMNPFLPLNISLIDYSKEVIEGLRIWTDPGWTQDEYLLVFGERGFIEPKFGWGMTLTKKLIVPSLGFSGASYVQRPDLIKSYFQRKKIVNLKNIISLRDTGEENYFHFFNDVISKLFLCKDQGIELHAFVIVISEKLYDKEYFKVVLENSWLKNLTWHVQHDEWIQFEKAVFCKPFTHTKKYFNEVVDIVRPVATHDQDRRIFLTRDPQSLRFIENLNEIQPLLKRYNFEMIDPSKLQFRDQANLFSECRFLIGIHGAGLTNMIFRQGKPLGLLEIIHPFEYIPFHYLMLAKQFDFDYNLISGRRGRKWGSGGFFLDSEGLELAIKRLLHG